MPSVDPTGLTAPARPGGERLVANALAAANDSRCGVPVPVLWAVADWMKLAILTVTPRAQVTGANVAAQRLLAAGNPLQARPDGLAAQVPAETRRLREAIAHPAEPPHAILLSTSGDYRSIPAVVASAGDQASVVFVVDSRQSLAMAPEALTHLFGLTRTEAQFAVSLTRGLSVEDASEALAIAPSTGRTHLKRIFLKTETNRQAQLVSMLLSLPGAHLRTR
jgi:DNA-binding CsgD family transcriptional regulator